MPEFPGGEPAFRKYINDEYIIPPAAETARSTGDLLVSFVVEKDGSLTDIVVLKDAGYGTGEELIRVLRKCIKWKPGVQNGRYVRIRFTLPVKLPPPHVIETFSELLAKPGPSEAEKLPILRVNKEKYMFSERFNCFTDTFLFEEGRQAISDRYSALQHITESISPDSLARLTGRIALQVVIDTSGAACLLSLQNELNMPYQGLYLPEFINNKTKWTIRGTGKEAITVILVFTFTKNKVKYQHLAFNKHTASLVELELSEKGKFTPY